MEPYGAPVLVTRPRWDRSNWGEERACQSTAGINGAQRASGACPRSAAGCTLLVRGPKMADQPSKWLFNWFPSGSRVAGARTAAGIAGTAQYFFTRLVLLVLSGAAIAAGQTASASPLALVSAANYKPPVAPNSLASAFGTSLGNRVVQASLDAQGQLPLELDGISVEVGGKVAPLVFVSPSQINCLIPGDAAVADVPVVVRSRERGVIGEGTASVRTVAPAIFSISATGAGPGAVLNGVTFRRAPFEALTPENPSQDKRTRLAIFTTGVRYAGNPQRSASFLNAATAVRAEMQAADGRRWGLPIEYTGPAPGFFGLDQVNVVLPSDADGAGVVELWLTAESAPSNRVTALIRSSKPPVLSAVSPSSAPPGSEIRVRGSGFANWPPGTAPRAVVELNAPNGLRMQSVPQTATAEELGFLLPPLSNAAGQWYQGPLTVCVVVDERRVCKDQAIQMMAPLQPRLPPGETVIGAGRQATDVMISSLRARGDLAGAASLEQLVRQQEERLRSMVRDAQAGRPWKIQLRNPDGSVQEVAFDLGQLSRIESLLAAATAGQSSGLKTVAAEPELRFAGEQACMTPGELELEALKKEHDAARTLLAMLDFASLAVAWGPVVTICVTAPATCAILAPPLLASYVPAVTLLFATVQSPALYEKWTIEFGPNQLEAIQVNPPSASVPAGAERQVVVQGRFVGNSGAVWSDFLRKAIWEVITLFVPGDVRDLPAVQQVLLKFATDVAGLVAEQVSEPPKLKGDLDRWVELGSRSLLVQASRAGTVARLQLRCASEASRVRGITQGREQFNLRVANENLLLFTDKTFPQTSFEALVNYSYGAQLTTSKSRYGPGEVVLISGVRFPPQTAVYTTLLDSLSRKTLFDSVSDDAGTFHISAPLSQQSPKGNYRVQSLVRGIEGVVATTFEVTDAVSGPDKPGVSWVSTDSSVYKPGSRLTIYLRTTRGTEQNKQYGLMLRLTSEATGSSYYFYDDASDQNRWIHSSARPMWVGVPADQDLLVPGGGQPPAEIASDTPSGRFIVTAYFAELGQNTAVGATAASSFVVETETPQGECFIATAAFGSPLAPAVILLREFRDRQLVQTAVGRIVVAVYYRYSPNLARVVGARQALRLSVRVLLIPLVALAYISLRVHPLAAAAVLVLICWTGLWLARIAFHRVRLALKIHASARARDRGPTFGVRLCKPLSRLRGQDRSEF
jgi:uncharacterized protein (TIGR03437 family)